MNIACHAPFDANWKVTVGVLNDDDGSKAASSKPQKTRQSSSAPASKPCDAPSHAEPSSETPLGTSNGQTDEISPAQLPTWSVEQEVHHGQDVEVTSRPTPSIAYDTTGILPWNSTWDFDFSLDPWLDCATPFTALETWDMDMAQAAATEVSLSTPTLPISYLSSQHSRSTAPPLDDAGVVNRQTKCLKHSTSLDDELTHEQSINWDDFFFQHYEHCISGWAYSLKDDGKGNYLRFVLDFIRGPNVHAESPFRLAVLAWTAKHWAVACQPGDDTWRQYYSRATAALQRLDAQGPTDSPETCSSGQRVMASASEVAICTGLFLCRCDVLNDDLGSILNYLETLKLRLDADLDGVELSAFASQILLWLGYLHVRVSIFASPCPAPTTTNNITAVSTTLLDAIASHPSYQQILDRSQTYLSEIFGDSYPPEELLHDAEKAPVAVRTHETFCLIANMLRYRSWKRLVVQHGGGDESAQLELDNAKVEAIDADMRRMDVEFGLAMATNPSAAVLRRICFQQLAVPPTRPGAHATRFHNLRSSTSPASGIALANMHLVSSPGSTGVTPPLARETTLHDDAPPLPPDSSLLNRASSQWLACYAVFLTAKILWSRLLHPTLRSEASAVAAVRSILDIALHLRRAAAAHESSSPTGTSWPHKMPRSMLWPLPLFVAGVETTDEVHADWIRGFMDEVTASWGGEVAMSAKEGREAQGGVGGVGRRQQGDGMMMSGANRVQTLMGRVRRLQDRLGCRVDIEGVVKEMGAGEGGRGFIL
ncbi:hypothetical protein JDV02_005620 [Purpureocillium takamizusanense]|uniref:Uncharacterized protein n=1 Tax=Purpureocillium takamizusanense TaxID=2060973 RepID=A0A9Q8QHU0_9HYPO|nr:uncharacterized protein JDV02_005620 [Purpureocillium takamizusanense]UNI19436.1 hypothetical protein JDV02_005620 [Purpureocillium takamizusanense]